EQIAIGNLRVKTMAIRLRTAVNRVMFRASHREHVVRIISLNALDEFDANFTREKWIFAVGLLAPPPARIPEDVDVGRPESQTIPPLGIAIMLVHVIIEFRTPLNADDRSLLMKQARIPGRRATDRFRKYGGHTIVGDSVQCFIPIIVSRQ